MAEPLDSGEESATDAATLDAQAPPTEAGHLDAFISYTRRNDDDREFVDWLRDALTERGKRVWVDRTNIPPATDWRERIARGIEATPALIFVISPESATSEECVKELDTAAQHHKKIVPVVLRYVAPTGLPDTVTVPNWIYARASDDRQAAVDAIVAALDTDIEWRDADTRLAVRAREWRAGGEDRSFLLRGRDLRDAEDWDDHKFGHLEQPTDEQARFIAASRRAATLAARVRVALLSVALGVALILAVIAFVQRDEARHQTRVARARELVASSAATLTTDPELSLWFATRAEATSPSVEADKLLREVFLQSRALADYVAPGPSRRRRYDVLAVSPDLRRALVRENSRPNAVDVRDLRTGGLITSLAIRLEVGDEARFNPNGTEIVAAGAVWSATKDRAEPLYELTPRASDVSFTRGGTRLVGIADHDIAVWDVGGPVDAGPSASPSRTPIAEVRTNDYLVAADRDGTEVATWDSCNGCNGLPTVYDVASGRALFRLGNSAAVAAEAAIPNAPHSLVGTAPTTAAAFSPDAKYIATGDGAGVVRVWLAAAPAADVAEFHVQTREIDSVTFSPDGTRILSGSQDGSARVFELSTGRTLYNLLGHTARVVSAEFSPDGDRAVTIHSDQSVRIWDTTPFRARTSPFEFHASSNPQLDDDGTRILDGDRNGDAGIWSLTSGRRLLHLRTRARRQAGGTRGDVVLDAALSANGTHIVAAEPDGEAASVWKIGSTEQAVRLQGRGDAYRSPSLDATGDRVATLSRDSVNVWDGTSGALLHAMDLPEVNSVLLDSHGTRLLVLRRGGASIWNASTGRQVSVLAGDGDIFRSPEFSPDGSLLIAVDAEGNARVWDTRSGAERRFGFGRTSDAASGDTTTVASFGSDGRQVLTISTQGHLGVWDTATGELLVEAPAFTISNQVAVTGAAFSHDRTHVTVLLAGVNRYECAVCASTPALLRRARTHISPIVASHAGSLSLR